MTYTLIPDVTAGEEASKANFADLVIANFVDHETRMLAAEAGKVPNTRTITAGTGLTGGGDLSANRSFAVAYGTTSTTATVGNDSRVTGAAQKASNLSDLASAATARTNLGLGGAAQLAVGTTAGTVAAGDDSRITVTQDATIGNSALSTKKIPYATYMPAFLTSGGFVETARYGDKYSSIGRALATTNTGTTVRSIIFAFMLCPDANVSDTLTGLKLWATTAGSTISYRLFTGSTLASLTGRGSTVSGASVTAGLKSYAFSAPYAASGTGDLWGAVQILTAAATPAFAAATVSPLALPLGKWGEYTTSTTAIGSSLNASADTSSLTANSIAWVGLY